MSFVAQPWVQPAATALFPPVVEELRALPAWAQGEPEWVLLGLIRSDVLRRARVACGALAGLHAFTHLVRAAILDPEPLIALIPGTTAERGMSATAGTYPLPLLGAAFVQERRKPSDLPLFLEYLAGCATIPQEDLYDMISLWGAVDDRVDHLIEICRNGPPTPAHVALRALGAPGHRGFMHDRLEDLYEALTIRAVPGLLDTFHRAFSQSA